MRVDVDPAPVAARAHRRSSPTGSNAPVFTLPAWAPDDRPRGAGDEVTDFVGAHPALVVGANPRDALSAEPQVLQRREERGMRLVADDHRDRGARTGPRIRRPSRHRGGPHDGRRPARPRSKPAPVVSPKLASGGGRGARASSARRPPRAPEERRREGVLARRSGPSAVVSQSTAPPPQRATDDEPEVSRPAEPTRPGSTAPPLLDKRGSGQLSSRGAGHRDGRVSRGGRHGPRRGARHVREELETELGGATHGGIPFVHAADATTPR